MAAVQIKLATDLVAVANITKHFKRLKSILALKNYSLMWKVFHPSLQKVSQKKTHACFLKVSKQTNFYLLQWRLKLKMTRLRLQTIIYRAEKHIS